MREIKFRGKRPDENYFRYGDLDTTGVNVVRIRTRDDDGIRVIPETVGQFTGLHDKNGVEIYEGDVVDNGVTVIYVDGHKQRFDDVGVVRWDTKNGCLVVNNKESTKRLTHKTVKQYGVEVIGTIHDKAGDE